ncbi:RagB/SusD family nutrient uptake outer membrane protein [Flavobacterium algicola]|uniref:RagB/SusD family nutrient uptake outer membrane protein n=1 Tax=Flavobacterium algicola TaxID=556529 RepID=UPI001EFDF16C|nr:RagB/SusD family nutrient uptake outer membrane protein [Flavobacterium algicola]MCG9791790.1 RagB/SusD family nutrient uptake outer membrane protein [Flavobacterium algicola]
MKYIYILLGSLLLTTACSSDLDQVPSVDPKSESLTDFTNVLYAAYYYQVNAVTPLAVMGDFRADNANMDEAPNTDFDSFNSNAIKSQEALFFRPFYSTMYKSILSCNIVINKSSNATQVAEAKFLRGLSYFKLVQVFGGVSINLSDAPDTADTSILVRSSVADVYTQIIADLIAARDVLPSAKASTGRATKYAAQGMLGKVYLTRANAGDFTLAKTELAAVVNGAAAAGFSLISGANYATIFTVDKNVETLFASQISGSISDDYSGTDFWAWYTGSDTKADFNTVDLSLVNAFTASDANAVGTADLRRSKTIVANVTVTKGYQSSKYPTATGTPKGSEVDWIELRLADVILLYAEALNEETDATASRTLALTELSKIRTRAGLKLYNAAGGPTLADTQVAVRQAIAKDRRLELAFEGQRWFDLLRYNKVTAGATQTAMASAIPSVPSFSNNFYLFPIPDSEISASFNVITQNPGY